MTEEESVKKVRKIKKDRQGDDIEIQPKKDRVEKQQSEIRKKLDEKKSLKQRRQDRKDAKTAAALARDMDKPWEKKVRKKEKEITTLSIRLAKALDMILNMEKERDDVQEVLMAINLMTLRDPNQPIGVLKEDMKVGQIIMRKDLIFHTPVPEEAEPEHPMAVIGEAIQDAAESLKNKSKPVALIIKGKNGHQVHVIPSEKKGGDADGQETQTGPEGQDQG